MKKDSMWYPHHFPGWEELNPVDWGYLSWSISIGQWWWSWQQHWYITSRPCDGGWASLRDRLAV